MKRLFASLACLLTLVGAASADCEKAITRGCIAAAYDKAILGPTQAPGVASFAVGVLLRSASGNYAGATDLARTSPTPDARARGILYSARAVGAAIRAVEHGQDDVALQHAKTIVGDEDFTLYLYLLGRHFARTGDITNAKEIAKQLDEQQSPLGLEVKVEIIIALASKGRRAEALMLADGVLQEVASGRGSLPPMAVRRLAMGLAKSGHTDVARNVYGLLGQEDARMFPGAAIDAVLLAAENRLSEALDVANRIEDPVVHAETLIELVDIQGLAGRNDQHLKGLTQRILRGIAANPGIDTHARAALLEQMFWAIPHHWASTSSPSKRGKGGTKLSTDPVDDPVDTLFLAALSPRDGNPNRHVIIF